MKKCKCYRKPKHLPYGSIRKKYWCSACDMNLVNPINKKAERQKAKRQIRKGE